MKLEFIKNNKFISKTHQIFKKDALHNDFTKAIFKFKKWWNNAIHWVNRKYACRTGKYLVAEKEEIKCNNIIKWYMTNFDDVTKQMIKNIILVGQKTLDHPCKILIIGGSVWRKTISLFNLINQQPDIGKIGLYAKEKYEAKCLFLINTRESTELELLLNTQMIWMIFLKILKNTILTRNRKY